MKKKITLATACIFIFSFAAVFSQVPSKQWDVRFGGSNGESLYSYDQTTDGGYILGGWSYSGISGDKTQLSQGEDDYWIVKTDVNGMKQWDARFGGDHIDELTAIQQTSDGGYILAGRSNSGISGDKTQESYGDFDFWIVKTDINGIKQWDSRYGGDLDEELTSVHQTADGGYILGGYSTSGISGDKTQGSQGLSDYWIVKTNANGVKQWDARFGGDLLEELHSVQQTSDGGFILGGKSESGISGDKSQSSRGSYDYWIVKTNANGVKQWDARFGGNLQDALKSLQQTTDGGYILGGQSVSGISGDKSQGSQGTFDYWMVKTDANGIKQFDVRFGGSATDYLLSIEQTTDGGYLLGGDSNSGISGDKSQDNWGSLTTTDYWIVKTDGNGIKQWDARFGGSSTDLLLLARQTSDGGYLLGGYSRSGVSGDKTQLSQGNFDFWIVKTDAGIVSISCNIPTGLSSTGITSDAANLNWDPVSGAIKYKLRYKIQNTAGWSIVNSLSDDFILNGLSASTLYAWQVKTICSNQPTISSAWSAKNYFTTDPLRLSETIFDETIFELFPNPVANTTTMLFSLTEKSHVIIEITDVNGRSLKVIATNDFSAGSNEVIFNRESLRSGIYFLQVKTEKRVMMKKFVVE